MKKFSIIIPVYNSAFFLEKCLLNIVAKKGDFEIILINDGSKDDSIKICKKYREKDKRIIILNHEENYGVSHSRNCGIKKASGEYIMFVDADDQLNDNWYNRIEAYADSQYDLIIFNQNINENLSKSQMYLEVVGYNNSDFLSGPWSKLFKRDFLQKNKILFNETIINGEDLLFNLKVLNATDKFLIDNKSIYKYRINNFSSTRKFDEKFFESDRCFLSELRKILPKDLDLKEELIEYSVQNACFIIIKRLSYLRRYKDVKRYLWIYQKNPYNNINKIVLTDRKRIFILKLLRKKMYFICYIIFKLKKIKDNEETKEFFINI